MFDAKVHEKEAQLREKEQKFLQQHDHMKRQLQNQNAYVHPIAPLSWVLAVLQIADFCSVLH